MENINAPQTLKAVIHRVYAGGPHGDYALALPKDSGPIDKLTFSLNPSVWKENNRPQEGEIVRLSQLVEKRAGWQAKEARFWSVEDEYERIKNLSLYERLAYYAEKSKTYCGRSSVIINFINDSGHDMLNKAFKAMDEEEKFDIFTDYIFSTKNNNALWKFAGKLIGLTVSANGRQIRAWLGFPELIIKNHAEGEDDCFFDLSGPKEKLEEYLSLSILKDTQLQKAELPNGMSLYLNWQ
jgi:hypothetical protein